MSVSRFSSQAGTRARSRVLVHRPQCGTNHPTGLYLHTPCRLCFCRQPRQRVARYVQNVQIWADWRVWRAGLEA